VKDKKITTIEGLGKDKLTPVQMAWKEISVPQCGYCQSGQIMAATALLNTNPNPIQNIATNLVNPPDRIVQAPGLFPTHYTQLQSREKTRPVLPTSCGNGASFLTTT
jgi:hypothetical protein